MRARHVWAAGALTASLNRARCSESSASAAYTDARSTLVDLHGDETGAVARWETVVAPGAAPLTFLGRFDVRDARISAFGVTHVS